MEFIRITSAQNDAVKHLVKLRDRRKRDKEMHDASARELDAMTPAAASEPNKNTEENY